MATRRVNGAAIRAIREALGLSQRELAARAGVRNTQISNVEAGVNGMSPAVARRVADELGVPLAAITNPVPEPETATA